MLTPTHLITAQAFYFGACIAAAHPPAPLEALAALGAALVPDLDSRQSYAGRLLPPLSGWLEHQFGHRTLTHSLLAQALAGATSPRQALTFSPAAAPEQGQKDGIAAYQLTFRTQDRSRTIFYRSK
jgi:membrane-bound metal-dependent hydrolase YbcI (DUF457 family)